MAERRDLIRGYATALFGIAAAEDALERVSEELFEFAKAVEQNHDFRSALTDIHVPAERKQAMVRELIGERASEHTRNILDFVLSQGRAGQLPEIVEQLAALAAEERNKVMAEIRTAVELDEATQQRLAEAIGKATGKAVEVRVIVDPNVIGGVYAKVGDQVIDGTVRRRLQQLRERLEVGG